MVNNTQISKLRPLLGNILKDLESNDLASFQIETSFWNGTNRKSGKPLFALCDQKYYIGGFNLTRALPAFSRNYTNLPPHNVIYYSVTFQIIDSWDVADQFLLQFDNVNITSFKSAAHSRISADRNRCGKDMNETIPMVFEGKISHSSISLNFVFFGGHDQDSTDESIGFRDIIFDFRNENPPITNQWCLRTNVTNLTYVKCNCTSSQYETSTFYCETCNSACSSCFGPSDSECFQCAPGFNFSGQNCVPCTLNPNGDCLPVCEYPHVIVSTPSGQICQHPCNDPLKFLNSWNNQCNFTCPSPLRQRTIKDVKLCDPPLCGIPECMQCNITRDCNEGYLCNNTIGGFCLLNQPYLLSATIIKTINNGYVILTQVTPIKDLSNIDEVLLVNLNDLLYGIDYIYVAHRVSQGIFEVTITILKPLNHQFLNANFVYSPSRLQLTAKLQLPKIIFINSNLQNTADKIGNGSSYGSYLFLILMFCFAVLGNLNKIWSFVALNQYMHFLLYLNMNYLPPTKIYLKSLNNYSLIFIQGKTKIIEDPLMLKNIQKGWPQRFLEEDYSISLLGTSGQIYGILLAMIVTIIISSCFGPDWKFSVIRFLIRAKKYLKWNGLIQQILTYSLPLTLSSFLQVNLAIFGSYSNDFSLMVSITLLLLVFVFWTKIFALVGSIKSRVFNKKIYASDHNVLWKGLSLRERLSRYFYLVIGIRGMLLAYLSVFADIYPTFQITALIIYQFVILTFFFHGIKFQRIFMDSTVNQFSFIAEWLLFMMKILILIYQLINPSENKEDLLIVLSFGIVGIGLIIQTMLLCFSIYMQIKTRKKMKEMCEGLYRKLTRKPNQKVFTKAARKTEYTTRTNTFDLRQVRTENLDLVDKTVRIKVLRCKDSQRYL